MNKRIYLDYQSSTPVDPQVIEKIEESFKMPANPHSSHRDGVDAQAVIDNCKEYIANRFDFFESELLFTSGATESNNLAIIGSLEPYFRIDEKRTKVFVSMIEHKSVIEPIINEAKRLGLELILIPTKHNGLVDIEFLEKELDNNTLFISVGAVNSEIGTIQPINIIGDICKENDIVFHVDATQAIYENIKPANMGINLMSLSSHKIYGPMGIGLLYVDGSLPFYLKPLFYGGGQQEAIRPGTLAIHQIVGFSEALRVIEQNPSEKARLIRNRNLLLSLLQELIPNVVVNGSLGKRHPGNLNIQFPNIDARTLVNNVQNELSVSTGSACSSGEEKPSSVLTAIGLTDEQAYSSIRISIGRETNEHDIKRAVDILNVAYIALLKMN